MEPLTTPRERTLNELVERRNALAGSLEPLTCAEALELLAVMEAIRRHAQLGQALNMRAAVEAGASWEQVADACGIDVDRARGRFLAWVKRQERLFDLGTGFGLNLDDRAAARKLLDQ